MAVQFAARSEGGQKYKKYMLRKLGKSFHITNCKTFSQFLYTMPKIGSQFEKKIESTRAIVTKEENSFAFLNEI
jgi:hypothetical protein